MQKVIYFFVFLTLISCNRQEGVIAKNQYIVEYANHSGKLNQNDTIELTTYKTLDELFISSFKLKIIDKKLSQIFDKIYLRPKEKVKGLPETYFFSLSNTANGKVLYIYSNGIIVEKGFWEGDEKCLAVFAPDLVKEFECLVGEKLLQYQFKFDSIQDTVDEAKILDLVRFKFNLQGISKKRINTFLHIQIKVK